MTLNQYLRALRKRWYLVLLFAVLGVAGAAAFAATRTPTYQAGTELFISTSSRVSDLATLQSGSSFTQARVASYANVITSPTILDQVVTELKLPYTAQELAGRVTADNPANTVLLDIVVSDSEAGRSARIANAIAARFPSFVSALEAPTGGTSPVRVTVTQPALTPTGPVSPDVPLLVGFGLLAGLVLGLATATLRAQLTTRLETGDDLERVTGSAPLVTVPFDAGASRQPITEAGEQSLRAEAYRSLRTNLQFMSIDDPAKVIVVTSALAQEGKTTTATNLATTLAASGARVALVDGDLRRPAVGRYLGISNAAGLTSALVGQHNLNEVLVPVETGKLVVLPSGPTPPNPSELLGSQHMSDLLGVLRSHVDYVVIDAPPLLAVTDAALLSRLADGAVLVVRHGRTRREELQRALQALKAVNAPLLGTVLNGAPVGRRGGYGYGADATPGMPALPVQPVSRTPAQGMVRTSSGD